MKPSSLLPVLVTLFAATPVVADGLPGVVRTDHLYDIAVQGDHVWLVGFPGVLLHSADRGKTFERQGVWGTLALMSADFPDARTGFVVGRGGLVLATKDGGANWEMQRSRTSEPLFAVDFVDPEHGWAVGNFAAAIRTSDGGKTWTPMTVAGEGEDPSLNGVVFLDRNTGFVVGEFGLIARTENGGDTFVRVESGVSGNLFSVAASGQSLVAVGADGAIVTSADGGKTFAAVVSGTKENLYRVSLAGQRVFVAGEFGVLLAADTPAGPYKAAKTPTFRWMNSVRIGPDGTGFAAGARAVFLVTTDNGTTWKPWEAAK
jgi:photosystem II stability/assembly factor-like uncharacterized protein